MRPILGEKYVITCDNWFYAPDGQQYRAAFGTVNQILTDEESLGIRTNAKSTNWYVSIGNLLIAGCQIHYAVKTDVCSKEESRVDIEHNGDFKQGLAPSRIYFADEPFA